VIISKYQEGTVVYRYSFQYTSRLKFVIHNMNKPGYDVSLRSFLVCGKKNEPEQQCSLKEFLDSEWNKELKLKNLKPLNRLIISSIFFYKYTTVSGGKDAEKFYDCNLNELDYYK
jgi:hypothetical protein